LIETADDPPAPLQSLADRLRWTISVSKARRLPIGARLFEAQLRQLDQALLEGANVADLDEALVAEGADIGFFEAMDAAGLDTMLARLREGTPAVTLQMIQEGRLGHATGVGWYRYPGGAGPVEDPITEDLARTEAWLARVQQSEVPANRVMSALRAALEALAETIMTEGHDRNCVAKIARLGLGVPQSWIDTWPR
jgi:3-hydroxyacyl-CoA dehydrogenase